MCMSVRIRQLFVLYCLGLVLFQIFISRIPGKLYKYWLLIIFVLFDLLFKHVSILFHVVFVRCLLSICFFFCVYVPS